MLNIKLLIQSFLICLSLKKKNPVLKKTTNNIKILPTITYAVQF